MEPAGSDSARSDDVPSRRFVTLRALLRAEGRLEPARAVALIAQALHALEGAHRRGLVHRDLSPENLLVEREVASGRERVRLIDFEDTLPALASPISPPTPRTAGLYRAPEVTLGRPVDGRADVYSCAVMLQELIAGSVISESLERAITRGREPDPSRRFADASELRRAIEEAQGTGRGDARGHDREGAPRTCAAPRAPAPEVAVRPTLLLHLDGVQGLRKLFLVAGRRITLGRNRQDAQRGILNDVILRVLPCRSRGQDPENFAATVRMSQSQLEIALTGDGATALDRSSRGTSMDGQRLPRWRHEAMPGAFRLDLGDGALALAGRLAGSGIPVSLGAGVTVSPAHPERSAAGGAESKGPLLVLSRLMNATDHAYMLADGPVILEHGGASARISFSEGDFRVAALEQASLALDGVPLAADREHACVPGLRLTLGLAAIELRSPDEVDFSTP